MKFKNTKKQGDWGVGIAIGYFAERGVTVSVPLTDSQDYDLVIDVQDENVRDKGLKKVQVKTTTYKAPSGNYTVSLTTKGGNRSGKGKIKKFDNKNVDFVFIVTGDNTKYFIPARLLNSGVTLGKQYDIFKLK